ncbi:E3 SUMO-protein ligase ZBED1-like, partial [Schistocerca piceifrons]|uniref:E3 SUMO-protein ligase ZBED1-like n=1 Tax=Schistocerca piceifrons TaxID=274613 RepID=UPI001F5E70AE
MKRSRRSELWNHFTVLDEEFAKCGLCGKKLSYKTSTTNLKKHIERSHVMVNFATNSSRSVDPVLPEPGEASLAVELPEEGTTASSTQGEAVPSTSQHQTAITEYVPKKMGLIQKKKVDSKLMGLFTKDYQPFSIVNDSGFRSFVHALNPAYEIPSRRTVTNVMLPAAYAEANEKVQQKLQGIKTICLTTDCWTSASNESYMAVTGHFINEQFRLQSVLLECSHFSGAHTSSNLSTALIKITDKFSLGGKILMVVTDNAPNIKNAISTILKWKHFGCYAHTLNLVVQDALKNVQEVHQKVKTIVGFFKRSSSATERLLTCQQNSGKVNIKKLIQDLPTRWNSTLFMLERIVELSEAVKITVALCNRPTDLPSLSNDEWEICSELCSILKPFEQVSRQLSAEDYPTGSLVIVLTRGLLAVCDEIAKMQLHEVSRKVVLVLKEGLTNRFSNLEQSKSIALATLLDPRFKLLAFQNQAAADNTKKQLINIVAQKLEKCRPVGIQPSQSVEPNNLATESFSVWGIFDKLVKHAQPQGTVQSCAIVEVQRYIDSSVISRNEDPLAWWRQNQYIYPTIAKVVKERFNVVATSVPCERVFSKTGHLINDRRTRLKP